MSNVWDLWPADFGKSEYNLKSLFWDTVHDITGIFFSAQRYEKQETKKKSPIGLRQEVLQYFLSQIYNMLHNVPRNLQQCAIFYFQQILWEEMQAGIV